MRIGFDAKRLYNNFTGLGNYSRALVHNLSTRYAGNSYYLYTPKVKTTPETKVFLENPIYKTVLPGSSPAAWWRTFSIVKQLQKDNIQLFHGLSHEIPVNLKRTSIKSIVTIHDLIFKVYPKTYSLLDRTIYDVKFKYSCLNSDKIIAISESTKKDIINYYHISPEKIHVIYQPCNPLFYTLKSKEYVEQVIHKYQLPQEYLLYVGSVIPRKNLITIIDAYDHLPERLQIPLVVVGGGGSYKQLAEQKIQSKKTPPKVLWLSNLKDNDHLQAVYQKAQMLIYPSLYEGFGIPIVEALLCNTPVLTSQVSSLPEAGGPHTYYLQNPTNPAEMAEAIEKIVTDSGLREIMREKGSGYAREQFEAGKISAQIQLLYQETISQG